MATTVKAIHEEVGDMFGQVPNWMRELPESALSGFWASMRDFHLAETVLPNKTNERIGIAVSGILQRSSSLHRYVCRTARRIVFRRLT